MKAALTEKQFQAQVIDLAHLMGWLVYHPFDSRDSECGFPDLTLVHCRNSRLIFLELKTEKGRPAPAQLDWLAALNRVPGIEARLVRPSDWPYIEQMLTRREG